MLRQQFWPTRKTHFAAELDFLVSQQASICEIPAVSQQLFALRTPPPAPALRPAYSHYAQCSLLRFPAEFGDPYVKAKECTPLLSLTIFGLLY